MSRLAHSSDDATMHKIERDARAREGAESAAMAEAELRCDLADEAATRRNYEWFCRQPNAPRIDFETYALAYGEKRVPTEEEMRTAYERLCADLKSTFPALESEYFAPPTFEEFKQSYMEDIHA